MNVPSSSKPIPYFQPKPKLPGVDYDARFARVLYSKFFNRSLLSQFLLPRIDIVHIASELQTLSQLMIEKGESRELLLKRGWCYLILGKFKRARKDSVKILKENTLDLQAEKLWNLSSIFGSKVKTINLKQEASAPSESFVQAFIDQFTTDPETSQISHHLSILKNSGYLNSGHFEQIELDFISFVEKSDTPSLNTLTPIILLGQKKFSECSAALSKFSTHAFYSFIYARCLQSEKKYQQAHVIYNSLLEQDLLLKQYVALFDWACAVSIKDHETGFKHIKFLVESNFALPKSRVFEGGKMYYDNNNFKMALSYFLLYLKFEPENSEACKKALTCIIRLNFIEECDDFLESINLSTLKDKIKSKILEFIQKKDYQKSLSLLDLYSINDPDDLACIRLKAKCYFRLKQYQQTIEIYEKEIKKVKFEHFDEISSLAMCYFNTLSYVSAFQLLNFYYMHNPINKQLRNWINDYLIKKIDEKIQSSKLKTDFIAWKAYAYFLSGKYQEANKEIRRALSMDPKHDNAIEISFKIDNHCFDFFNLIRHEFSFVNDFNLYLSIFDFLQSNNNITPSFLIELKKSKYFNDKFLIIRAWFDIKNSNTKEAIEKIKESYKYNFDDAEFYARRGILLNFFLPDHPFPSSLDDFHKALSINPNHYVSKKALMYHYIKEQKYDLALNYFQDLEFYLKQICEDIYPNISLKMKTKINQCEQKNTKTLLLNIDKKNIKNNFSKFISLLENSYQHDPFTIRWYEKSIYCYSILKIWLRKCVEEEIKMKEATYKEEVKKSLPKPLLIDIVSSFIKKWPHLASHQIEEQETTILIDLIFDDPVACQSIIPILEKYNVKFSLKSVEHFLIYLIKEEMSERKLKSLFNSIQFSLETCKIKSTPIQNKQTSSIHSPKKVKREKSHTDKNKIKTNAIVEKLNAKKNNRKEEKQIIPKLEDVCKQEEKEESVPEEIVMPKISSSYNNQHTHLPLPSLDEGIAYLKKPKKKAASVRKESMAIIPVNGLVPGVSSYLHPYLDCAILHLTHLQQRMKYFFGEDLQLAKLNISVKNKLKRECEYYILKVFEALDLSTAEKKLDSEYGTKIALSLCPMNDIKKIKNLLYNLFAFIRSEWVFKLGIELLQRNESLKALKMGSKLVISNSSLKTILNENPFKKKVPTLNKPSAENNKLCISIIITELQILKSMRGSTDIFQQISTIKKCLYNIQKLTTYLTSEEYQRLISHSNFEQLMQVAIEIKNQIPAVEILDNQEEIIYSKIFKLIYKDRQFFEEMFELLYLEKK